MSQQRGVAVTTQISRRGLLCSAASAIAAAAWHGNVQAADSSGTKVEWRNRQTGMAYRQLGRTGLMTSEVICGGDPIKLDNYQHLNLALEMGLNYLDMAPAYDQGQCEEAYGKLIAGSSARREKVYLTTKISSLNRLLGQMYRTFSTGFLSGKEERHSRTC